MHSTPLWIPSPFARSEGFGIQFVYRLAMPKERAIAGDMSLISAGWLPMSGMNALQICAPLYDRSSEYDWIWPVEIIDIVSLKTVPSVQELLDEMYKEGDRRASSDGLLNLLEALFELTGDRQFSEIEWLLQHARTESLAPEFCVGILRATANSRHWLPSWGSFRETVRRELVSRGMNANQILMGLGEEASPIDQQT
jgi:hypothetical protein